MGALTHLSPLPPGREAVVGRGEGGENRIDQRMPSKPDHGLLFPFQRVSVQNQSVMAGPKTGTVVQTDL